MVADADVSPRRSAGLPAVLPLDPEWPDVQTEIRAWLAANLPPDLRVPLLRDPTGASGDAFTKRLRWQKILNEGGWAGIHWPREYGGRGAGVVAHATFLAECAAAGAPEPVNVIGLGMAGPTLIAHGSQRQLMMLPSILSADQIWCQLYSEPGAGSDLGMIGTAASAVDGGWSITGQKTWCSWGAVADRGLMLARTDHGRFDGLTCFVVDMHATGVDVRPMRQINGSAHFCDVFFDDVFIPSDDVVGGVGAGWKVATTTLLHERTTAIFGRHGSTIDAAARLVELADLTGVPHALRDHAYKIWCDAQLLRLSAYRGLSETAGDAVHPALYIQRLAWGVINKTIFELAVHILSAERISGRVPPAEVAEWEDLFLASRGWTIGGGTSEIQRNMLAGPVLKMARSR